MQAPVSKSIGTIREEENLKHCSSVDDGMQRNKKDDKKPR